MIEASQCPVESVSSQGHYILNKVLASQRQLWKKEAPAVLVHAELVD